MRAGFFALPLALALATPSVADYETGLIAAQKGDHATALKEWRPLAERGHPVAQVNLGFIYATGRGVTQDDAEAVRWYQKAAEQDLALAQFNLGVMYASGRGVNRDVAEAGRWYRSAADQGLLPAQFNLGMRYSRGTGLPLDNIEAYFWLSLAADGGYPRAAKPLARIQEQLSDEQRGEAQARILRWRPRLSSPAPPRSGPTRELVEPPSGGSAHPRLRVQLAALRSHAAAEREWDRLQGRHPDLIGGLEPEIMRVDLGGQKGVYYRLRAGPLADPLAASELCSSLSARRVGCLTVSPSE